MIMAIVHTEDKKETVVQRVLSIGVNSQNIVVYRRDGDSVTDPIMGETFKTNEVMVIFLTEEAEKP